VNAEPCPAYLPLVVRAGDGSLDADRHGELLAHIMGCSACRTALEEQSAAHVALATRPATRASAGFVDRVMIGIPRETWLDVFDFRRLTWRLAPVALMVAVLAYSLVAAGAAPAQAPAQSTDAADVPVSAALMSEGVSGGELVPLMLFANPEASLFIALQEGSQ
jgi:anti-sigma factor RsiW